MRKAQMEMMGLVIIVVLITMIFLFVVKFDVNKEPDTKRKEFLHSELASNTLSAMLKMDSRCDQLSMTELFQDCGRNPPEGKSLVSCTVGTACVHDVDCGNEGVCSQSTSDPSKKDCKKERSCIAIETATEIILNMTLSDRGYSFNFSSTSTVLPNFNFLEYTQIDPQADCVNSRESEVYPIPLHPGTMFVTLQICG